MDTNRDLCWQGAGKAAPCEAREQQSLSLFKLHYFFRLLSGSNYCNVILSGEYFSNR